MVLSEKQKLRLRAQGRYGENMKVAAVNMGISQGALNSCNTRVFVDFNEMLEVMNEYYPIFERRFNNSPESLSLMKKLSKKIRKSSRQI
jgi:hypothetical protein